MTEISAGNSLPSDLFTLPYTTAHPPDSRAADDHNHPSSAAPPPAAATTATGSISKGNRRSLAGFALEKTSNVLANLTTSLATISTPALRTSTSHGSLSRHSHKYSQVGSASLSPDRESSNEEIPTLPLVKSPTSGLSRRGTVRLIPQEPLRLDNLQNKMHQTSSRLLRMTEDERPFTKDFNDLFATLMVSLKLDTHRVRFTRFEHTFTSDEAINNLGSLKFSQSNRMPDPKDPSRIVTTTTTTTFSMAKEMARSVCQRFADARFIESVDGRGNTFFPMKGGLYQLTPKGINILQRFCQRNGITARHVMEVLESPRNTMQLVNLERDSETDKLSTDRATIEVIFRRFAGQDGPNIKTSTSTSDSDSLSDYSNGLVGVKMAKERKIADKFFANTFTGKAAVDWLMDCSTTNDRRETCLIAALFIKHGLITSVQEDRPYAAQDPTAVDFQPTKHAIYTVTEHGQRVCGWIARDKTNSSQYDGRGARDSNNARLNHILHDAALRLLFREFLRYSLCEENLTFYLDVSEFTSHYHRLEKSGALNKIETVRETLAAAYGLYNAFLAPGSPCELNIEHGLRNSLASRMTKAVGDDESMLKSLQEVVDLFELAQTSVFKLMSSDSVPKFVRDPKYSVVLQEHEFDLGTSGRSYSPTSAPVPERSLSRSVRT
ncbi:developmental regulator FlbA [Talaromyces stipitatus ATCC 10500]|uniref:Developmental regulator FlbA n=1 Tax=Talaromyces stipitatus (strain ATCC 10500 / CBS 375.48 / QM 6759 / NRRL 1006) TaxID=441959 RepID=B8M8X4_TALSN|nr:developmental regulator FlbA [Talaromyces stipitatus ATCC 10500]EED20637.1 developmental regulator FlbA [Talaromyces stipitatus ATCC 10500]